MSSMTAQHPVIALEQAALARWCRGDPSGFLELSAADVSYFDPFQPRRLDGIAELAALYATLRGQISAPHYEMIDPRVTLCGNAAVLSFRFNSWGDDPAAAMRWNCTEVYRYDDDGWRIVQTHWSLTGAGC
jgi:hypothetical protein